MVDNIEPKEAIKVIRRATDLTQKAFAEKYGIPVRTLENWERGVNVPPPYLVGLLWRVVFQLDYAAENDNY